MDTQKINAAPTLKCSWSLFTWQNARRLALSLAVLATVVALFYAVENYRGKRAFERYRLVQEAKGEVLNLVALAPPPVLPERNLAMAPVMRPMMQRDDGTWPIRQVNHSLGRGSKHQPPPWLELEAPRASILEGWQAFYRGNTNYPDSSQAPSPAMAVLTALGRFEATLEEVAREAARRPQTRYPLNYAEENPAGMLLPHESPLRRLAGVLHLRAVARLENGQAGPALEDLELGLRLINDLEHEPILISELVRVAGLSMLLPAVREGLARRAWNEDQLAGLQRRLETADLLAHCQRTLRGERAFNIGCIDFLKQHPREMKCFFDGSDQFSDPVEILLFLMPVGWYDRNKLHICRLHDQYTLAGVDPAAHRIYPDRARINARAAFSLRPWKVLAGMLFPTLERALIKSAKAQTFLDAAAMACALERYRLAKGAYPEALAALSPQFMTRLPTDVMNGEPLRYRRDAASDYLIYSVGWNQRDDGGQTVWTQNRKPAPDPQQGDWVWRAR